MLCYNILLNCCLQQMEYYYYVKNKVDKWLYSVPPVPQNIGDIPLVTFGFIVATSFTLAAVTLSDKSTIDTGYSPPDSGNGGIVESIKKAVTPSTTTGGSAHKPKHNKTMNGQRKKSSHNKTR